MSNQYLDFIAPVTVTQAPPDVSTGYVRNVLVVSQGAGSLSSGSDSIQQAQSAEDFVTWYGASDGMEYLFTNGVNKIYCATISDLAKLAGVMEKVDNPTDYFTILIDGTYGADDIKKLDISKKFKGVVAYASKETADLDTFAGLDGSYHKCAFYAFEKGYANMFEAFGKLLTDTVWSNMQCRIMSTDDGVESEAKMVALYEKHYSCVAEMIDESTGSKQNLMNPFMTTAPHPIIQPYIFELVDLLIQNTTKNWIYNNGLKGNVDRTIVNCKNLANTIYQKVKTQYIDTGYIRDTFSVDVTPDETEAFKVNSVVGMYDIDTIFRNFINVQIKKN